MVRTRRSAFDLNLAEAEDIVSQDAEMRQMLVQLSRRQAGGGNKSGRYNKHDTARLRFIRDRAFQGLRLGILVPEADLRMLRLPPQEALRRAGGADWASMEEWAERHGRDPRSQKKTGGLCEMEQLTLLRFVSKNAARFRDPANAARGAPSEYTLDFGAYEGCTLLQLVRHANSPSSGRHLLSNASDGTPMPGACVMCLLSTHARSTRVADTHDYHARPLI